MAMIDEFDIGVLKFMPAYECLKAIHRGDRLLRHTEGNDDVHHDVDDGEERPIRGSDRALVSTTSPSSSSSSSSSSCEYSLAGIISPSASSSSSSSEVESYSCSKKALDDDKINKWITSKVFFMPAAATDRPFDKSSSTRLRRNRDNIFGQGSPDVATVLELGRETMRAPFAASAATDIVAAGDVTVAGGKISAGHVGAAAAAATAGERKKKKTAGTELGSRVGTQASAVFTDDAENIQDKKRHAAAAAAAAANALPSVYFSAATPRSEYFWGVGDW